MVREFAILGGILFEYTIVSVENNDKSLTEPFLVDNQ